MSETTLQRLDVLEQTVQGCLTQAVSFRQYLTEGPDTTLVQEEYSGLCEMLQVVFQELCALARKLEEDCTVTEEEVGRLYHKLDPHLY